MTDAFVSYTQTDETWAEWIAWTLEGAGLSVVLQKWDFRPGGNFVLEMQRASTNAERTLAVLSPDYLLSAYAAPEWAAAFARDPGGIERRMVPVLVRPCRPAGLLAQLIHIDLVGLDEVEARVALLAGLSRGRAKPATAPSFPGQRPSVRPFPGPSTVSQAPTVRLKRAPTDLDKRRFLRESFAVIAGVFRSLLTDLQQESPGVETDFLTENASAFAAEIYVDGKLKANCRVWIGGMFGDMGISYAEGTTVHTSNATNEVLSIADGDQLAFAALMHMGIGRTPDHIDPRHMSPEDAAHYLWARLLWRLS